MNFFCKTFVYGNICSHLLLNHSKKINFLPKNYRNIKINDFTILLYNLAETFAKRAKIVSARETSALEITVFQSVKKNTSTNRSISRISVRTGSTIKGANSIVTLHQLTARWRGCETTFVNIWKIKNESNCFISEGRTESSAYRSGRIIKASSNDQCMVGEKMILIKQHTITPN